jgi:hypothetical protein
MFPHIVDKINARVRSAVRDGINTQDEKRNWKGVLNQLIHKYLFYYIIN